MLVPEAVGTAAFYRPGDERLGVHPALRLLPPRRALSGLAVERILVGHGPGVGTHAAAALETALVGARRGAPRLYAEAIARLLR